MTLTQLRYIIAIADTGSMNEAAKSLFISQPSLSLAVKELEKEIETKKVEEEKKHESLEVLREKLVVEAEDSLKQTFGEEKVAEPHKKLNTEEMYEELNKEKEHLSEMTNALKEQQLSKKKH